MQVTEPEQQGEDLRKEPDVPPSQGRTEQLVIAHFRGPGWRILVNGNLSYVSLSMGSLQMQFPPEFLLLCPNETGEIRPPRCLMLKEATASHPSSRP